MKIKEKDINTIMNFFEDNMSVGLKLPNGWFGGRPMENHHKISYIGLRPKRLIIELDNQLLLIFSGKNLSVNFLKSKELQSGGTPSIEFKDFQQFVFEYLEYGSDKPHLEIFNTGIVNFISG